MCKGTEVKKGYQPPIEMGEGEHEQVEWGLRNSQVQSSISFQVSKAF